jgi:hypothetical protein
MDNTMDNTMDNKKSGYTLIAHIRQDSKVLTNGFNNASDYSGKFVTLRIESAEGDVTLFIDDLGVLNGIMNGLRECREMLTNQAEEV